MLIPESTNFSTLVEYFSFTSWIFIGCTVVGLLFMRWSKPNVERPYRVSFGFHDINILISSKQTVEIDKY